jgi:hypothetical protein
VLHGLTENHERSLLASVQYAARLSRDCDDMLDGSGGSDPLSRYTRALSTPQEKIAREGLGSVTPGGALQTYAYPPRCDHATFLFEATAPVGEEDLTVLAFLHDAGITTSVLLSKADLLDSADLDRVRTYVARQIRKKLRADVPVRPMSTIPSHESPLRDCIRDDVAPLGGQAHNRAQEALRRKTDVLRQQAIAALERHTRGSGPSHTPEVASSIAAHVRDMSARSERTSRELLSLQDRKTAIVGAALGSAAHALADGERLAATGAEALRADLVRSSQDVAAEVAREIQTRALEVQTVLTEAANATGVPAPVFEPLGHHRKTPLLDVPPLSLDLQPPLWARANQHLLRRWITERVRDRVATGRGTCC